LIQAAPLKNNVYGGRFTQGCGRLDSETNESVLAMGCYQVIPNGITLRPATGATELCAPFLDAPSEDVIVQTRCWTNCPILAENYLIVSYEEILSPHSCSSGMLTV